MTEEKEKTIDVELEKALADKEKALAEKEEELAAKEKFLADLQEYLAKREQELTDREKAMPTVIKVGPAEEKPISKEEQKLIDEGCKAYGIPKEFLFHKRIDREKGQVVLVTHGGKKVRYSKGMEVEPLTQVQVDGKPTKKPRHVMGKKK